MDLPGIRAILGEDADVLLGTDPGGVGPRARLLPGPDFVERAWSNGPIPAFRRNFQALFDAGRLAGTGHLCLLDLVGPAEDPARFGELAVEGGCSGLVLALRHLDAVAPRFAHRLPLIVGISADADASVLRRVRDAGAVGVELSLPEDIDGAAIVATAAAEGLPALLSPLTAAAEPSVTGALAAFGAAMVAVDLAGPPALRPRPHKVAEALAPEDVGPALLALKAGHLRAGRAATLGSVPWGGAAGPGGSLRRALRGAVLHKRAGGFGAIAGLAATALPLEEAVALLHAVQDVWACGAIGVAR
jgi:class I fructose-bisphosphate aldolase